MTGLLDFQSQTSICVWIVTKNIQNIYESKNSQKQREIKKLIKKYSNLFISYVQFVNTKNIENQKKMLSTYCEVEEDDDVST